MRDRFVAATLVVASAVQAQGKLEDLKSSDFRAALAKEIKSQEKAPTSKFYKEAAAAFDGDERDHIHGPESGMLAGVPAEIDVAHRAFEQREHRLVQRSRLPDDREDGPIVGRVRRVIQEPNARDAAKGARQSVHDLRATSFTHIGDAFDEGHKND